MPQLAFDGSHTVARVKGDTQLVRYLGELEASGAELLHLQEQGVDRDSGVARWVVVSRLVAPTAAELLEADRKLGLPAAAGSETTTSPERPARPAPPAKPFPLRRGR